MKGNTIKYKEDPLGSETHNGVEIAVFTPGQNLDKTTVSSFGDEWKTFSSFDQEEIERIGDKYFQILLPHLTANTTLLDAGCGTGRWSRYLSPHVGEIEAIDPSDAVHSATQLLKDCSNARVTRAGIDNIPFTNDSFDVVCSVGVLHHMPNTLDGIKSCVAKIKSGGWMYVYLYYALDNRGFIFRLIFQLSNLVRGLISKLPNTLKQIACDFLAVTLYLPFVTLARVTRKLLPKSKLYEKIPLCGYIDESFWVMRNDSRDRFGTPLEQRFTRQQIEQMFVDAGLTNINFSENLPFWCAIGQKP